MRLKWQKKKKLIPPKYLYFLLLSISWHHGKTFWLLPPTKNAEEFPCPKQELKTHNCQSKRWFQNAPPNAGDILRALANELESDCASALSFIICVYELPQFNGEHKKKLQRHWLVKYFYNCETCIKALCFLGRPSKGQGTNIVKHMTMATATVGAWTQNHFKKHTLRSEWFPSVSNNGATLFIFLAVLCSVSVGNRPVPSEIASCRWESWGI